MGNDAPIGVFDSGIGGLTVAKEIRQMLPGEDIIYVGDTARVPYGSREPEEIVRFMNQILRFLAEQKVKMAVIACNTMTGYGYQQTKGKYGYLLLPMNSAVEEAVAASPDKRIGVIATQGAVQSQMHKAAAAALGPEVKVYAEACPAFVPLIEGGRIDGPEMAAAVDEYMAFFAGSGIEALILGCTHYPLVADLLRARLGETVRLINPARSTAADAVRALTEAKLLNERQATGRLQMFFSGDLDKARKMAKLILKEDTARFKGIDLAAY